jgi:DNA-binding transcriptional MerR regulator
MTYRTKEVAKVADISITTLYEWLRKGKVAEPRRDRNNYRIWTEEDLRAVVDYRYKHQTQEV